MNDEMKQEILKTYKLTDGAEGYLHQIETPDGSVNCYYSNNIGEKLEMEFPELQKNERGIDYELGFADGLWSCYRLLQQLLREGLITDDSGDISLIGTAIRRNTKILDKAAHLYDLECLG